MKRFVRDLKEKDHVHSVFLAAEKSTAKDRNGKFVMSLSLSDSTGTINGRMFERAEEAAGLFESGDPVMLKGFVQVFQGRRQLIVHEIRRAREGEFSMNELVAELGGDPRGHLSDLQAMVSGIEDVFVRELLQKTFADPQVSDLLLRAPAAKTIHHAYRGGLVEHIHSIARVMESVASHYKFLRRDWLIFGAIYHDIGKIFELDLSEGIRYTDSGRLVGHMAMACEMIDRFADTIPEFPRETRDLMKHVVLSHHGKLEYGSPKVPMVAEAMVVSMIDDLDSKMNTLFHFLKAEKQNVPPGENWSHFHPGFERYFYLGLFR